MKTLKTIVSFCFCILSIIPIYSQNRDDLYKEIKVMMSQPVESNDLHYSDNKIDIIFVPVYKKDGYYFIGITIKNTTNDRLYIEWENFRIDGSKAVFDDDRRLFLNLEKRDEMVASGEESEYKEIMPKNNVGNNDIYPLFGDESIGKKDIPMIIPIRFKDDIVDYRFSITFSKYNEAEIDSMYAEMVKYTNLSKQIKKKMTIKQVIEIMGENKDGSYIIKQNGEKDYINLEYPHVTIYLDEKRLVKRIDRY